MKLEGASRARLLKMLSDRFGALEAVVYSSIKLSCYVSESEMSMDLLVAEAVLEARNCATCRRRRRVDRRGAGPGLPTET